jgi:DNA-binding LacI/PurR family transcriptional regulator
MASGSIGGASRRVTAADVARSLGLSRATVGFVLNDTPGQTIPDATKQRVVDEAKRLGYRPHTAARALASGRSRIVLLVLPDWPLDHSLSAHLDEASLVLDRAGYSLVTMTPHPDGQAVPLWETLSPDVVIAMVPLPDDQYAAIIDSGAGALVPGRPGADDLARDLHFTEGPGLQVEHLFERGCRRIAYAGTPDPRLTDLSAQRRELAARTYEALSGGPLAASADVDQSTASAIIDGWREIGIDGVVAYNDDIAALVVASAIRSGISVPGELKVVGHDDAPLAALYLPAISSVRLDSAGLGRYLAELALSEATGSPRPVGGPETSVFVVPRETT